MFANATLGAARLDDSVSCWLKVKIVPTVFHELSSYSALNKTDYYGISGSFHS